MTQKDFFSSLIEKLKKADIPFMVTGSFASSYHGEPRASNDADIVIAPTRPQLENLISLFSSAYYVDPDTARDAFNRKSMFNVIDSQRGWKADLIFRKERPFSREEFRRRIQGSIAGIEVSIVSLEDIILAKLEWAKAGRSELQFRDAVGVAVVQMGKLDLGYLKKWARELGVDKLLQALLKQAVLLGRRSTPR